MNFEDNIFFSEIVQKTYQILENVATDLLDAKRVWVATNITILYLFQYKFGLPYCIFSR